MFVFRRIEKWWFKLSEPGTLRVLYHGVTLAPRLILHVASLAALVGLFNACVPATRYEEAKSASEVERVGHERARAELNETKKELAAAQAELAQGSEQLAETQQSVSASKLESTVAVKERDEATGLVEQLRGELARVGDNLRSYAQQKADLEKSLQAAQTRKLELERNEAHTVAIARLTRDLTSALGDRVMSGDVMLDVRNGRVVLSAAPELCFNDDSTVREGMGGVLTGVSRVLALYPSSKLELSVPSSQAEPRGAAMLAALGTKGVAATRATLGPDASTSMVELSFSVD
jgi:hypothetical protein